MLNRREYAQLLHNARLEQIEIGPLSDQGKHFSLEEAYDIQEELTDLRLRKGDRRIGFKLGLTSKAKMEQMGLHQPVWGSLTREMQLENGGTFSLKSSIHPKIEPEVAFVTAEDISRPLTPEEAWQSCEAVMPAMEILDSRFKGFKYFSLEDVVADECSASHFVLGEPVEDLRGIDPGNMTLEFKAGEARTVANSNAILGNPLNALAMLTEMLCRRGKTIPEGSIILSGAVTAAAPLESGMEIETRLANLGRVSLKVSE